MAYPFTTISSNTDSLNTGSYYSEKDLATFNVSQSTDIFFGNSNEDVIEFSIFDITGAPITWKILDKIDTYSIISETYKDVDGILLNYTYKRLNTNYNIATNRHILLNTVSDLTGSNIQKGNQVVSYNFLRNVAGNNKYKLVIKGISSDRKEIQLVPATPLSTNNEEQILNNLIYTGFAKKTILVNDIVNLIENQLKTFNVSNSYYNLKNTNPAIVNSIKTIFGLSKDADIIKFLIDVYNGYSQLFTQADGSTISKQYDGIKKYIINWLYTYYNTLVNISELKVDFKYIINTSVKNNLTVLNSNFLALDVNNSVDNFINSIFYETFISPMLDDIGTQHTNKFHSYLKNIINFGDNLAFPILNHSFILDENGQTVLIVKLLDYLSPEKGLRDTCWVSNISIVPIIQKVILDYPSEKKKFKISGPNFKINPKIQSNSTTKTINYKSENQLAQSTLSNQIDFNKKLQILSVDYSDFKNFIVFSSAQLRIKLFKNKLNQLTSLNVALLEINEKMLGADVYVSTSYNYDISVINKQIDDIFESFDGYESYLYKNQLLSTDSKYNDYLTSSIDYDFSNRDSLVNNTPEFINGDVDNSDYLVFLSMAGHFFDNIYLYIQNFPTSQYISNSQNSGFVNNISNILLEQFGWSPIGSTDNSSQEDYYLDSTENSSSLELSGTSKMKTIWSRILNNLPMIYKTKGTEESIRLLANIYGIPNSFLNVKEFGGNSLSTDDISSYTFDRRYYFMKYNNENEYVALPCDENFKSLEFKFSFNPAQPYYPNDRIYLAYKSENFQVYIDKTREDYMGTMTFQLNDKLFQSSQLPLFNGKVYNTLIKTFEVSDNFDTDVQVDFLSNAPAIVFDPTEYPQSASYSGSTIMDGGIYYYGITYITEYGETAIAWGTNPDYDLSYTYTDIISDYAIVVDLPVPTSSIVTSKRIWRTTADYSYDLKLLAEVPPEDNYYIDYENHADFSARSPESLRVDYWVNTTGRSPSINKPNFYTLSINTVENDRVVFEDNVIKLLPAEYLTHFTGSNIIQFGNIPSGSNNFRGNIDKVNIWNTYLSSSIFLTHCKNFDGYDSAVPRDTYESLYFRLSYDYPENLASSSVIPIINANKYYSGSINYYGHGYNFPNTTSSILSCSISVPFSEYPYQFDQFDARQNIGFGNLGPNKFKNSKINKISQRAVSRLMSDEKSTTDINISNDSNLVAVYASPFSERDLDIINFLGNYNLMDDIGNPVNLYEENYKELIDLRRDYNKNNLAEPVLYQEFMTLYKNYIDSSFFNSLNRLVPARSKLIRGILIEPSLLERNKYKYNPINTALSENLDVTFAMKANDYYNITSSIILYQTASINIDIAGATRPINYIAQNSEYISDSEYLKRNCVFPFFRGSFVEIDANGFNLYYIYKNEKTASIFKNDSLSGIMVQLDRYMNNYQFVDSRISVTKTNPPISNDFYFRYFTKLTIADRDNVGYPQGHLSTKRNNMRNFHRKEFRSPHSGSVIFKKSSQNSYTTVGEEGIPNGKSPIEVTSVNKQLLELELIQ